jgi:dTDP-4-amino-4,6-dideoxygalactose transaminase
MRENVIPFNDLKRHFDQFRDVLEPAALAALESGWWLAGPAVAAFSGDFAAYVGVQHCVPVANGTDALEIALRAAALTAPDRREVVTVANAGGYSTVACLKNNLLPCYADVEAGSQLLSIDSAVPLCSHTTLAVVATHLYGRVVDVELLRETLDAHGHRDVLIIEDCAQAHGARLRKRRVGGLGDVATFSFYPTKNLGALGDGGAVVTNRTDIAELAMSLHQYGWGGKYEIVTAGGRNSRMDEIQASMLTVLLPHLESLNQRRAEIWSRYSRHASPALGFVASPEGAVNHLAVTLPRDRTAMQQVFRQRGIATQVHYPILDTAQPAWRENRRRVAAGGLPNSEFGARHVLSIPSFPSMTEGEIEQVEAALYEARGLP